MQKIFLTFLLISGLATQALQAQGLTTEQRKSVETIIYDYLLKNPLVVRQALDSLQVQEENQKMKQVCLYYYYLFFPIVHWRE